MRTVTDLPNEVLHQIFSCLDLLSLRAVLQVNRKWFDNGVPIRWRHATSRQIQRISKDRRHKYVFNVRHMVVSAKEAGHCDLPGVTHLHVLNLVLRRYKPSRFPSLWPVMQEHLHHLALRHSRLDSNIAIHVVAFCKNLRSVSICGCYMEPSFSVLVHPENLKLLDEANIDKCEGQLASREVLKHLATHRNLKRLHFGQFLGSTMLAEILGVGSPLFPALESLSIHVPAEAVPSLAQKIPHLKGLSLTVYGACDHTFLGISQLTELQQLSIWLEEFPASGDEIIPLASLTNLERLQIESSDLYFVDRDSGDMRPVLPHFAHSHAAVAKGSLYTAALNALSVYCRQITTLRLPIMVNLLQLLPEPDPEDFAPRFPRLRELDILGFETPDTATNGDRIELITIAAQRVVWHMPLLEYYTALNDRGGIYEYEIKKAWAGFQ